MPSGAHAKEASASRGEALRVRLALLCALSAPALAGCGALTNSCDDRAVPNTWTDCGSFRPDDQPRLWTGEAERTGPTIEVGRVNAISAPEQAFAAYSGNLRIEYKPNPAQTANDVAEIAAAGNPTFNAEGTVSLNFENATIAEVLRQVLTGILQVSYIAPDPMPGTVNFRTEQPIPRGQVMAVLRDILARNGLVIRYFNGVYQVGTAEAMAAMESNARAGRAGEIVTRVVRLPRGGASALAALVLQVAPPGSTVVPTAAQDALVIRATAGDAAQIQDLVNTLNAQGATENRVAIIPLQQSDPTATAAQVMAAYGTQMGPGAVTVLPLASQRALLVTTRDPGLLAGLRRLVAEMDYSVQDQMSLRIVALQHLKADEIANQLNTVFGAVSMQTLTARRTNGGVEVRSREDAVDGVPTAPQLGSTTFVNNPPLAADADEDGGQLNVPGMMLPPGGYGGAQGNGNGTGNAPTVAVGGAAGADAENQTRIVPDPRSNALMVYSTYSVFKRIQDVVRTLDVPQAQVVIEATVVEVDLNDELERGVQWWLESEHFIARSALTPEPVIPTRPGGAIVISGTVGDVNVDVVLTALQAVTKVKVISSPYLTVVDGKPARLLVGDQIPYMTSTQTSSNTGGTTVTEDIEIKDTGIILEVTPKINANNSVDLKINQSVTTPSQTIREGNKTPIIATRDIQSDVLVQSGRTVLLGGLIQDRLEIEDQGVPSLRSVPLVGALFRHDINKMRRTELLVMITPRVVRHSTQLEDITRQLRMDTQAGFGRVPALPPPGVPKPVVVPAPAAPAPVHVPPPSSAPKVTKP